jgi:cytochrome P450
MGNKAHAHYTARAKDLISDGLSTHKGPVVIATRSGSKLVLPSSLTDWVKNHKDLGHAEHVRDEYFSEYSGFEGSSAIHGADHELVNIIKTKLSKNEDAIPILKEVLSEALELHWGTEKTWHTIDWQEDTTALISRASASVFAGIRISRNKEWLKITTSYVMDYFTAVGKLREWPLWLHPVVHWCLPLSRSCKRHMKQGRTILDTELERRLIEKQGSLEVGTNHPLDHNVLEWTTASTKPQVLEPIVLQLGLAVAALFTTSEALRQTILEISKQPKLILELREEINEAISRYGWTAKALFEMRLLDSVMKEAQRTLPILGTLLRVVSFDIY